MKKLIFTLIFALMIGLSFTSCTKHDFDFNPAENVTIAYNKAFVNTFGIPDTYQNWGFTSSVTTRSVIKENHELPSGYVKPTLEDGEAEYVMNWFRTNQGEASEGLDWNKFFIIYVGGNNNVSIWSSWNNSTQNGNVTLDYLEINGEHINDWNANNGPTVYVYNNTPNNFTCHNSYCNLTTSKWKLARITYNGNVGYYVGLSAYGKKVETTEKYQLTDYGREHFYDDWVFKVVPANGVIPPTSNVRIIGEDLSATQGTDFDFNDIVLDVNIVNGNANCILQAAGGTLPLRINSDDNLEVHKLFGVDTSVMVNTGIGNTIEPVSFPLQGINNASQIKLEVFKDGLWIEMKAQQGVPAAKIAVNQDFEYCGEREPITTKYPNFKNWVQDVNYIWW
jgi:hypothetical protein